MVLLGFNLEIVSKKGEKNIVEFCDFDDKSVPKFSDIHVFEYIVIPVNLFFKAPKSFVGGSRRIVPLFN